MKPQNTALRALATPVAANLVLVVAIVLQGGTALGFLDPAVQVGAGLDRHTGAAFLQFLTAAWFTDRLLRMALTRPGQPRHQQPVPKIGLYFITAVVYLGFASAGLRLVFFQTLETIFAASGIFSLVVGFALRGLVSDVFSGIALHADTHLAPGEWLELRHRGDLITARLIEFDWRCAMLEDRYGNVIIIPNGEFSQTRIRNLSRPVARHRLSAQIEVAIEHDHAQVCNILANACAHVVAKGQILANPPPEVRLREVAEGVARFDLWFFIAPGTSQSSTRHAVLDAGIGFLKAAGVPLKRHEHHTLGPADAEDLLLVDVRSRILRQIPFLAILDARQIERLAEGTSPRRLAPNDTLIQAGEAGDSMFVVLQGHLGVHAPVDGRLIEVASLWPRDILGEMSLFTGAPRSATVVAKGPATVLEIGKPLMGKLLGEDDALAAAFAHLIVARQTANQRAAEESRRPAIEVVAEEQSMLKRIASFFGLHRPSSKPDG